jgi:hypothetical protein
MSAPSFVLNKRPFRGTSSTINSQIDNTRKNTKRVILFTNARNEKNMKEWAAHHLLIGFDLVYIFDHKSEVPLKNEFVNFDKRVIVERCEMSGAIKIPLMNKATAIASSLGADWFLYLDADEFLILNSFYGVKQMLNAFNYADALSINWLYFGSNHHVSEPTTGLLLENYTKSDQHMDKHVKSFVRPSRVTNITNPHFYHIQNPSRNITINNKSIPPNPFNESVTSNNYNMMHAYIAHYVNQSEETYIKRKVLMPTDDTNSFRPKNLDIHNCHNTVVNLDPKNKYADGINKFLEHYA